VDRHQQGGRLHFSWAERQYDHRSDHQADPDRRRDAGRQGLAEPGTHERFDVTQWVDDSYVRKAFAELKLDYDAQLKSLANHEVTGQDAFCNKPIADPRAAGEVWVDGEGIAPFSSTACTLGAYSSLKAKGKKINVAYVFDTSRGIKLFADQAYYAVGSDKAAIAPFLLKKDAEAYAAKNGGKVLGFEDAVKAAISGG
jgi:NitT/TauT family transport system substrate-binding protein